MNETANKCDALSCSNALTSTCSGCKLFGYCSLECQRSDWKCHKKTCKKVEALFKGSMELQSLVPVQKGCLKRNLMLNLPDIFREYMREYPNDAMNSMLVKSALEVTKTMHINNLSDMKKNEQSNDDMLKRWQDLSGGFLDFYVNAQPGDVNRGREFRPYEAPPQQFRNSPIPQAPLLVNGTTVVEFGFVDFGITIDGVQNLHFDGPPLLVFAFDKEPLCIAKSLVMCRMMSDSACTRSVVEVWLSSLWSLETLNAFKDAVSSLVAQGSCIDSRVLDLLVKWNSSTPATSDETLRYNYIKNMESSGTAFALRSCNFVHEKDRVEMIRSYLTKALYEDETTIYGSVVMQDWTPCDLIEASPVHIHGPTKVPGETFLDRIRYYFCTQIDSFGKHLRNGSLVFTPKIATVALHNEELIKEVKALNPYIIAWSNLSDYIKPNHFHSIARGMSGRSTVHYVHSCNWSTRVNGTDIFDLNDEVQLHYYTTGLHLIETSHALIGCSPSGVYHFRGICNAILSRTYLKRYLRYFFESVSVRCSCFVNPISFPNPLSRDLTVAFFCFAYADSDMSFSVDAYDYLCD